MMGRPSRRRRERGAAWKITTHAAQDLYVHASFRFYDSDDTFEKFSCPATTKAHLVSAKV